MKIHENARISSLLKIVKLENKQLNFFTYVFAQFSSSLRFVG